MLSSWFGFWLLFFSTLTCSWHTINHYLFLFCIRMSISWRSPCFLRECPCCIRFSCLLPNLKRDWTYRECTCIHLLPHLHAGILKFVFTGFLSCPAVWLRLWQRCPKRSWANTWKPWCLSYAVTTFQTKTWKCPMSDTPSAELRTEPTRRRVGVTGGRWGWGCSEWGAKMGIGGAWVDPGQLYWINQYFFRPVVCVNLCLSVHSPSKLN